MAFPRAHHPTRIHQSSPEIRHRITKPSPPEMCAPSPQIWSADEPDRCERWGTGLRITIHQRGRGLLRPAVPTRFIHGFVVAYLGGPRARACHPITHYDRTDRFHFASLIRWCCLLGSTRTTATTHSWCITFIGKSTSVSYYMEFLKSGTY